VNYQKGYQFVLAFILISMTATAFACPCFHRYYLYSIFFSEKADFDCPIIRDYENNPDTRVVSMISYYSGTDRKPANYGQVSSEALRCILLIDHQVITKQYTSPDQKTRCDNEIIQACYALKKAQQQWPEGKKLYDIVD
jgi:hypothetical protein